MSIRSRKHSFQPEDEANLFDRMHRGKKIQQTVKEPSKEVCLPLSSTLIESGKPIFEQFFCIYRKYFAQLPVLGVL